MHRAQVSINPKSRKNRKPYVLTKQRQPWTYEEDELFLLALTRFTLENGRVFNWKGMQQAVPTRTVKQLRSHYQKYQKRMSKKVYVSETSSPVATPHDEIEDVPLLNESQVPLLNESQVPFEVGSNQYSITSPVFNNHLTVEFGFYNDDIESNLETKTNTSDLSCNEYLSFGTEFSSAEFVAMQVQKDMQYNHSTFPNDGFTWPPFPLNDSFTSPPFPISQTTNSIISSIQRSEYDLITFS